MFGVGAATRIYLAAGPTDLRKSFEGLYGLVRDQLLCDPLSGHLFLFTNAQRNRLRLLFYDGSGLWVCAKRLDRGRFRWPEGDRESIKVVLTPEELALLQAASICGTPNVDAGIGSAPPPSRALALLCKKAVACCRTISYFVSYSRESLFLAFGIRADCPTQTATAVGGAEDPNARRALASAPAG